MFRKNEIQIHSVVMPFPSFSNISLNSLTIVRLKEKSPLFTISPSSKISTFSFQNCKFSKLFDKSIFSQSTTSFISIKRTEFSDILSTAISIDSQNFDGMTFKSKPEINSSYLQVTECQFLRCKSHNYDFNSLEGGGLLLRGIIADISNCIFRQCFAYQNGAAIRVSSSARINVNGTFMAENNAIKWCGGISLYFVYNFTMGDCNITTNKVTEKVAGLMVSRVLEAQIINTLMANNTALSHAASWIESSTLSATNMIFVKNNADIASSLVTTQRADVHLNDCFFSDLNRNPSILCEYNSKITIIGSKFAGTLSDEILKEEGGQVTTDECKEGEKTEVELPLLSELPPDTESEEVKIDVMPNLNLNQGMNDFQRPGVNRHTFDTEAEHGFDKSTIMIIAYAIVIMLLIVGLRMYFSPGEAAQNATNSTSIFGDDDYENNAGDFLHTGASPVASNETPLGSKPEMEKLIVQDVPLAEEP